MSKLFILKHLMNKCASIMTFMIQNTQNESWEMLILIFILLNIYIYQKSKKEDLKLLYDWKIIIIVI